MNTETNSAQGVVRRIRVVVNGDNKLLAYREGGVTGGQIDNLSRPWCCGQNQGVSLSSVARCSAGESNINLGTIIGREGFKAQLGKFLRQRGVRPSRRKVHIAQGEITIGIRITIIYVFSSIGNGAKEVCWEKAVGSDEFKLTAVKMDTETNSAQGVVSGIRVVVNGD